MNETVKVSILIPAYNVESYIDQCLESAMNQTLREIEIIVVDDCSTDATLSHIEAAAERDSRIRVILHESNQGTHMARKNAVLSSHGDYIMFVDADDWIEPDACEKAYTKAVEAGVDILHYGTVVENCGNLSESTIKKTSAFHLPRFRKIFAEPLVSACFQKKLFNWSLWNKLYRGDLARSVYAKMEDGYCIFAEDVYQSFLLLMESETYLGTEEKWYHYCFGRGITGRRAVTPDNFAGHCQGAWVWSALDRYVRLLESDADGKTEEQIKAGRESVNALQKYFIREELTCWQYNMKKEDRAEALLVMEAAWKKVGCNSFIALLAENAWDKQKEIADALAGTDWLKFEGRSIRTIALYFVKLRNGGTERVMALLCNLFAEQRDEEGNRRFQVVLITDEPPSEDDYALSPLVIREQIPRDQESKSNYAPRAAAWKRVIEENTIDMIVYPNWRLESQFMDFLTIKRTQRKPALVLHVHIWSAYFYQKNHEVEELKKLARISDGIVTLSEADRLYWSRCNPRSVYIPNPCFVKTGECRRAVYGKHILWLARIARQKQPMEIPRIMREAVARDPEIVCHVVGAWDTGLEKELRENIAAEGLSENVIMQGFHADVTPFYEKSALFLMTSRYEGFPLTLFEAAAYGLPTVLYEMPWLAYNDLIDGAIAVPQRDASAAAEAIVRIVNDPEEWQRRSDAIYNSALRYEKTDITAYWMALIESLEKGTFPDKPRFDRDTEILLDQIDEFHDNAVRDLTQQRDQERKKVKNLERKLNSRDRELESIKGSVSFRVGRALTWAPRKVRGLVRCCREHDAKYTFERILFHLHLGPDNEKRGE